MFIEPFIEPDTKDWTWVLHRPCDECGLDTAAVAADRLPGSFRENAAAWIAVLADEDAAVRPVPTVWSTLEYACHVRDVHRIFASRVALMLAEDDPAFQSWDQDAAAVQDDYGSQQPATVAGELAEAAEGCAAAYGAVTADQWARTARRSDGAVFTVESLGRYHLHDVVHHLYDVRS